jgi:hypothetical protein
MLLGKPGLLSRLKPKPLAAAVEAEAVRLADTQAPIAAAVQAALAAKN